MPKMTQQMPSTQMKQNVLPVLNNKNMMFNPNAKMTNNFIYKTEVNSPAVSPLNSLSPDRNQMKSFDLRTKIN